MVEMWRMSGKGLVAGSASTCVRERLAAARSKVSRIDARLSEAEGGLRQQMQRENDLTREIGELEERRAPF